LKNLPPIIFGDGEQTRDFIFGNDVVSVNMSALNCPEADGSFFHIDSGEKTSVNQLSEELKLILNKVLLSNVYKPERRGDIKHSCARIDKALVGLKWRPNYSLKEGPKRFASYYNNIDYENSN
jgi:UDP-glucose 4-epimerase